MNDSVSVDLPAAAGDTAAGSGSGGKAKAELESSKETQPVSRLSTARAITRGFTGSVAPGATALPIPSKRGDMEMREAGKPDTGRDVFLPASPPSPPASTPVKTETLRSVGRVSLAVDFPQEGRVYHFKKIKSEARLTLLSTHPERFVRLGWLGVLLVGTGMVWGTRKSIQWRKMRRRNAEYLRNQSSR